jgi:hypothetical protein
LSTKHHQKRSKGAPNPIKLAKLTIRLAFPPDLTSNLDEHPAKGLDYSLDIGGERPLTGTTDSQGVLHHDVPAAITKGTLTLYSPGSKRKRVLWVIKLQIGDIYPLDSLQSITGLKARLNNLGLFCSTDLDEASDEQFWRAIRRFTSRYGESTKLPTMGDLPAGPRIKEVYGN